MIFGACKKDDDDSKPRTEMMVGTWRLTEEGFDLNSNGELEMGETAEVNDTTDIDRATFSSDGTGTHTLPGSGSESFNWSLVNHDNTLRIIVTGTTDTMDMAIKGLTDDKLTLLYPNSPLNQWEVRRKQ